MHVYLEILISIIGLFILFSIINSIFVEWIADQINARGRYLKSRLFNFFEGKNEDEGALPKIKRIFSWENRKEETKAFSEDPSHLGKRLYSHPLIRAFFKSKYRWPSYIDGKVFSEALVGILKPAIDGFNKDGDPQFNTQLQNLPQTIREPLTTILEKASEVEKEKLGFVQGEIESLYNAYMARTSQWYKKRVRFWLWLIGTCGAFLFNIDTINIYRQLSNSQELRKEYYDLAVMLDENRESIQLDTAKVLTLMSLSYENEEKRDSVMQKIFDSLIPEAEKKNVPRLKTLGIGFGLYEWGLFSFLGIALTGIALSFGSTFWFDMLRKLIKFGTPL